MIQIPVNWDLDDFAPEYQVIAQFQLRNMALTFNDLLHRRTLDLGAGPCCLGFVAKNRGFDVLSLDNETVTGGIWGSNYKFDVPYIVAQADRLPLADESFDYVLSHDSPPIIGLQTLPAIRRCFAETLRVLKPGGELRFCPDVLIGKYVQPVTFTPAQLAVQDARRRERYGIDTQPVYRTFEQRQPSFTEAYMAHARRKSHDIFRSIVPDIEIHRDPNYCVVRKK